MRWLIFEYRRVVALGFQVVVVIVVVVDKRRTHFERQRLSRIIYRPYIVAALCHLDVTRRMNKHLPLLPFNLCLHIHDFSFLCVCVCVCVCVFVSVDVKLQLCVPSYEVFFHVGESLQPWAIFHFPLFFGQVDNEKSKKKKYSIIAE